MARSIIESLDWRPRAAIARAVRLTARASSGSVETPVTNTSAPAAASARAADLPAPSAAPMTKARRPERGNGDAGVSKVSGSGAGLGGRRSIKELRVVVDEGGGGSA